MEWMVGWKESKLVDVQRFPKGIAGISQGPQEGQKIPQSSTHLNKQADKTSGTHGTGNTPKFRGDTQNVSSGDKLVIHIFSQSPNPLLEGWVLKDGGETRVKQLQTSWHACALCRTRVVPDGVHSMFPRIRLHRAEGEETL